MGTTVRLDAAALAAAIDALGGRRFAGALLALLSERLRPSHLTAFRFDAGLRARVVLTASASAVDVAMRTARVYTGSGLYRHDRLLAALRRPRLGDRPFMLRTRRSDIRNAAYGRQLWDRFGLVDRLTALSVTDGPVTALNVYRDTTVGPFGRAECRALEALAPALLALLRQHLASLRPEDADAGTASLSPDVAGALLRRLPTALSARELEVCALTLAGHTRRGIGLALGIAESSVATLRGRAYRKLHVHGTGELFAVCLPHAARREPDDDASSSGRGTGGEAP
jgi:DNA-binding CsgD family transcriptional regulator